MCGPELGGEGVRTNSLVQVRCVRAHKIAASRTEKRVHAHKTSHMQCMEGGREGGRCCTSVQDSNQRLSLNKGSVCPVRLPVATLPTNEPPFIRVCITVDFCAHIPSYADRNMSISKEWRWECVREHYGWARLHALRQKMSKLLAWDAM